MNLKRKRKKKNIPFIIKRVFFFKCINTHKMFSELVWFFFFSEEYNEIEFLRERRQKLRISVFKYTPWKKICSPMFWSTNLCYAIVGFGG